MIDHPSIHAPFIGAPDLQPAKKMEPYVPCWCLSGKKWKFCHKDRDKREAIPIGRLFDDMSRTKIRTYCAHPKGGEDCGKVIGSHSIQRNGGLSAIAEQGHVYSLKAGATNIVRQVGRTDPVKIGCGAASTFAGFCGRHDSEMFAPIEQREPGQTKDTFFLFAFRAISYELFQRELALAAIEVQRQADCSLPFYKQVAIQRHLHSYRVGLIRGTRDVVRWKSLYDETYLAGDYRRFSSCSCWLTEILPVASCGAFYPEVDFDANQLQIITRGDAQFESMALSITPVGGRTLITLGWFGNEGGPAERFARSFFSLPSSAKANAAIHLAFEHLENTYCKPGWWDGLDKADRDRLMYRARTGNGVFTPQRLIDSLENLNPIFSRAEVVSESFLRRE